MAIEARAYDGAIAFRYVLPEQPGMRMLRLEEEHTQFNFDRDASTWALELPNFRSGYESEFIPLSISAFSQQGGTPSHMLIGLPLLTHIPGAAWLAITEADLESNSVMYLTSGAPQDRAKVNSGLRRSSNWSPRDVVIPLKFLGAGKYTAEIYRDATDADRMPQHVTMERKPVSQADTLTLHLAPGGGCTIRFVPAD